MTSYIIPFVALLPPCFMKNNKNALDHAEFASNAMSNARQKYFLNHIVAILFLALVAASSGSGSQ